MEDIEKIGKIINKYRLLIEELDKTYKEKLKTLEIEYKDMGIDMNVVYLRGEKSILQREYNNKIIALSNKNIITLQQYAMQKSVELEINWPYWASSYPGSYIPSIPKIELFKSNNNFITIHTPYKSTTFEVIPKSSGGYYINSSYGTIEITSLSNGNYYVAY